MKQMNMTVKFHPMYAAANILGYGLPFMNEICKRAFISGRPFLVAKDENGKYFVEAGSLQKYIDTCPDFNPFEIPGVYEPDSDAEDAPMDDTVFMLTEEMLPQVCGVMVDEECAPLISYRRDEKAYLERFAVDSENFFCTLIRIQEN